MPKAFNAIWQEDMRYRQLLHVYRADTVGHVSLFAFIDNIASLVIFRGYVNKD